MPRIDPVQLLKCLSVLLTPSGGIKSRDEVNRLATLMNKFSKKLVSKCIYIQILKRTDTALLNLFMEAGGWNLVHMWLSDGSESNNGALIKELLELLLVCPLDVERLKINSCPKLVKELSKQESQPVIRRLASKLVEQWLKLVKGDRAVPLLLCEVEELGNAENALAQEMLLLNGYENTVNNEENSLKPKRTEDDKEQKQQSDAEKKQSGTGDKENEKVKKRELEKSRRSSSTSSSHSEKSSKSKHSSSRRHSDSNSTGSDSHRSSSKSSKDKERHSSSGSSKDVKKSKDKKYSDKDKSDRTKVSSSKSKEDKPKDHSDKKDPFVPTMSIMKLGKIPKKSSTSGDKIDESTKEKPSLSVEVRKTNDQNRPKTVKTFNSKFRSHGLEEEAKPPLPRGAVKKPTVPPPTPALPTIQKRSSPVHIADAPPEKKSKLAEITERPGSIKLIPPKPKPTYLLESGLFMDALTASATTNKKEPKKRKRRTSDSKESKAAGGDGSPPTSPTPSQTSPTTPDEPKSAPLRFYQDTLDTDEDDKAKAVKPEKVGEEPAPDAPSSPAPEDDSVPAVTEVEISTKEEPEEEDSVRVSATGLRGVLTVHKRKGPKKSLRWRDTNLEEVQYFELDETERVNVTKTFHDMKMMEHNNEREAFKKGRNIPQEDFMEERMVWRTLIPIDDQTSLVKDVGKNSKEKHVQMNRQAQILQAIYFHKSMIPDSPAEPDHEVHPVAEPVVIPIDDVAGNPEGVNDFQTTPWPEPKTNPQSGSAMPPNPHMYPPMASAPYGAPPGFNGYPMPNNAFPMGMPPMQAGMMMPPDPAAVMSPEMYMTAAMGGAPVMYQPQPMNDYTMMDPMNQGPPNGYQGGYGGSARHNNYRPFQKNRGGRGPPPRGGPGPWRSKGPGWNGPHRGGHRSNRPCTHFQKKGFCREGDNCTFVHATGGRY